MLQRVGVVVLAGALAFSAGLAPAADQDRAQQGTQVQKQEQIYGSQLMTEQERAEFQARMRAAKTDEERVQLRKEQHERLKVRARESGVTLPEEPAAKGGGMGPRGGGRGPGGGMGQGGGSGR